MLVQLDGAQEFVFVSSPVHSHHLDIPPLEKESDQEKHRLGLAWFGLVTRIRFHSKMQRYLCGFTSCLHGNDENDHENANISIHNPNWIELKTE